MVTGATLAAARAVWTSAAQHGASLAGGLHHAMAGNASGFCVYNDPADRDRLAAGPGRGADRLRRRGRPPRRRRAGGLLGRPAGTDRSACTSTRTRCSPAPGGQARPAGRTPTGRRSTSRCRPGTGDAGWLRAFHAVVPPVVRAFGPQLLVSQHGCDSHRDDPLANLELSIDGQRAAHAAIHALAHEVCGGRWLLTGGGGYEHVHVVPRTWTHLLFEAAGAPLDPAAATPELWREYVSWTTSQSAPGTDDRGRPRHLRRLRVRPRPGRSGRPGHHGHQESRLPAPRADALTAQSGGAWTRRRPAGQPDPTWVPGLFGSAVSCGPPAGR